MAHPHVKSDIEARRLLDNGSGAIAFAQLLLLDTPAPLLSIRRTMLCMLFYCSIIVLALPRVPSSGIAIHVQPLIKPVGQ